MKPDHLLFLLLTLVTFSAAPVAANKLKIEQFISPETCGDCHGTIYNRWENSLHNQSHVDPVYNKVADCLRKNLTDANEIAEAESCVKCHTPIGNITGFPLKTSDDRSKSPEIAKKGIQCDYCHSATGATKPYNNGLIISPGNGEEDPGIKRGPFKDSESDFHETEYSSFHTRSDICGTCHDVRHVAYGTVLESTFTEWKTGPYNSKDPKKRVNCQDCHMYQRPGIPATGSTKRPANKGKAADNGPIREHIFTHYFVGGNVPVPTLAGDRVKGKMATERLQNAAELTVDTTMIAKGKLSVTVKNTGAGHYLPTGLADVRQMWLEIVITDSKGTTCFSSGVLNKNGYLPDGSKIYNTVFGDGKGQVVSNISKAKEVLKDSRIPPHQSVTEHFSFKPQKGKKPVVTVKLLYRSAPQQIVDTVFGKGKMTLPVIEMERVTL